MLEAIQAADDFLMELIQNTLRSPVMDNIMKFITHLGDAGIIWIIITIVFLCIKKYRKFGFMMAGALILMHIGNNLIIKNIVGRARPYEANTLFEMLIPPPDGSSFPSSHAASSFACALVISFANKKFAPFAYLIAAGIAFSRMYLYVHYPSDVFFGILTGTIYAVIAIVVVNKIYKNKSFKPH